MAIKLDLSIDETNQILQALAKQPFESVNTLIAKIHKDASGQLQSTEAPIEQAPVEVVG